jgi:non-specific serine/threonine protein kinase
LDGIAALADASLLHLDEAAGDEPRYRMLETIREFAVEELEASGEAEAVRGRHAAYFLDLAQRADTAPSPEIASWLDRLERDYGNLRGAIDWLEQTGDAERFLRLAGAMAFFWFYRGRLREGLRVLTRAIDTAHATPVTASARAFALSQAGLLANVRGDVPNATVWLAEAVRLSEVTGETTLEVTARARLGGALVGEGRYDDAEPLFAVNRERARELGEETWWMAHAEFHLGAIAFARGDAAAARPLLRAAAARYDRTSNPWLAVDPLRYLGLLACAERDVTGAATLFAENLARLRAGGVRQAIATTLADIAVLATAVGKREDAARLFAATDALRESEGTSFSLPARARYDAALAEARSDLGEARFREAHAGGTASLLPEITALAEIVLTNAASPPDTVDRAPAASMLTEREAEVLRLLAAGRTNIAIAEALHIGPGTVRTHVSNILSKLSVRTRTEAATYAHRQGLV